MKLYNLCQTAVLLAVALVAGQASVAQAQSKVIYSENFESVKLGDSVDEGFFGEGVWTNKPPAGITIMNDLPGIDDQGNFVEGVGVTEWKGWSFADKDWWVQAAGDQRRSEFELGEGAVAIADPDEWDDLGNPKQYGLYNTWMTLPAISLAGIQANSLLMDFGSSWRPEAMDDVDNLNNQTAEITASFDGAPPVRVMFWDSDAASETYHDHAPNEEVNLAINNPAGAKNVVFTFGLLTSYNDWWWAVDNIVVRGKSSGGAPGDFNANGSLDVADIDALSAAIRAGNNEAAYDVTGDSKVDTQDHAKWVRELRKTWIGDANLDGQFNTGDFVIVFQAGRFETGQSAGWGEGDWNADAKFDTADFVAAFQDGGFEAGPRAAVAAVPEPSSLALLALGGLLAIRRRRV
jgi:hypothetical protein